ncbi:MAG TPA: nodulation protein NfeD [Anaerolineae bacterium]|nr:nodulation protein NfeD [Anaerolineae bacterium]MCB0181775.1 nodulation protein NfeD [Anaerolineae bacterium]MCB9106715.1 nodulation protein NfeD [Anaerolineales bacterium]HRV90685.1 nodulation protein NfeD [Anaerolineae bacterium]
MARVKLAAGFILTALIALWYLAAPGALAQQSSPQILVADVDGPVTPVMLSFIERAIAEADARNAEALILRLDTPGGEVSMTKRIIQTMIAADVPVVVYVWPPGGGAISAGTFITMAAHINAMAPNTSIGAASPVGGSGEDIDDTMRSKVENMLIADMKGLTDRRGEEAIEWVEKAITEAKAATAQEALEIGIIDFIADDVDDLVEQLDGFTVEVGGDEVTLDTGDATISFFQQTFLERLLGIITNPSIALLLISMGSLAIVYEIINPGGYMSGIIGVILLLVGFYAIGQLPVNYAGLALILLGIALFVAELFTPTFGALTAGGIAAFIFGGLILFNTSEFAYDIPLPSIIGIPLGMAAIMAFGFSKVLQSRKLPPTTGQEAMIGATGTVKVPIDPKGSVLVWGERWEAVSQDGQPISAGEQVEVTEMKGFRLKVKKTQ